MRPRTPTFIWLPFVFSIGTISWALLLAGLAVLAAVVVAPAMREVNQAQATRNDYHATLELLDQQIALQKDFADAATKDPLLMERLASRQLNLNRKDQDVLILDPSIQYRDRSVKSLLAESLQPITPTPVKPLNDVLSLTLIPGFRSFLVVISCVAITLSFFLGVKFERH